MSESDAELGGSDQLFNMLFVKPAERTGPSASGGPYVAFARGRRKQKNVQELRQLHCLQ